MLDAAGDARGFDVARMKSYEVHGLRVSSSAVREALAARRHGRAPPRCSAGPTASAATWCTARKLGPRARLSDPEPALRAPAAGRAAASSSVRVHGLADAPLPGVANLGMRPRPVDERRPRAAGDALPATGRRSSAPTGATVKSSAWNCCTNCTTSCATTVAGRPDATASRQDVRTTRVRFFAVAAAAPRPQSTRPCDRAWPSRSIAATPPRAGRPRATEFARSTLTPPRARARCAGPSDEPPALRRATLP